MLHNEKGDEYDNRRKNSGIKKKQRQKQETDPKLKAIISTINTIALIVYLILSFTTWAWHITWIVFIISMAVKNIAVAVYNDKKESKKNEEQ